METVLIDVFSVPEENKHAFLEGANRVQRFIRTLPGFVEGYVYERTSGDSPYSIMTTAVWESESAFEQAKQAVALENQRQGINPQDTARRLGVTSIRSVYQRSPY